MLLGYSKGAFSSVRLDPLCVALGLLSALKPCPWSLSLLACLSCIFIGLVSEFDIIGAYSDERLVLVLLLLTPDFTEYYSSLEFLVFDGRSAIMGSWKFYY